MYWQTNESNTSKTCFPLRCYQPSIFAIHLLQLVITCPLGLLSVLNMKVPGLKWNIFWLYFQLSKCLFLALQFLCSKTITFIFEVPEVLLPEELRDSISTKILWIKSPFFSSQYLHRPRRKLTKDSRKK